MYLLEKTVCFLLQTNVMFFLPQNENSHIKYNKEVIGFHLLSFFDDLTFE